MSRIYKISELIMNNEKLYYTYEEELKKYKKIKEIKEGDKKRYLTWVDDKNMKSITTPEGRELTAEELFDFIIGNNITDFSRTKDINLADIAIVLGNGELATTRERSIKAFELYKLGIVKKIIFTGGLTNNRDVNGYNNPTSLEQFMENGDIDQKWSDLPEADWGAETFIPDVFEKDYKKHKTKLTAEFLNSIGVNPEDVITEALSVSTQENAEFCKNIFESEEIETGTRIKSAVIITTCTHGSRAMRQFKKVFGNKIDLRWCPSTLDLEKYKSLKSILKSPIFDKVAFSQELKRIYCNVPQLTQKLREETANHRNAFILGDIDEPYIITMDKEIENDYEKI